MYSLIQIYKGNFSTLWEISLQILYGFYSIFEFIISDDADAFKDKIDWLKTNIDPPEKVKQFWRDTSKKRVLQLIENDSYTSYFSDFVVLRHVSLGPELV